MGEADDPLTYPPLSTLKPVAQGVWVVDGPAIGFGLLPGLEIRHPTRMTVLALDGGSLFLHSPTACTPELKAQIDALGKVAWIVGPNRVHYWWIADWHAACPDAEVWLAPRILAQAERAGRPIHFGAHELATVSEYPWDRAIDTLPIPRSGFMTEYEFFHRASRTLVLTDLVENFEPQKVTSGVMRLFIRLGGATGKTPRDIRLFGAREPLRRAVDTMIGWQPERILLAHGRWYQSDGAAELRRIFAWLRPS